MTAAQPRPMRMRRLLANLLASALVVLIGAGASAGNPANAAVGTRPEVYIELTPVSLDELRQMRGGLRIAGLDIDFGAVVRVYVNNVVVASTVLMLNSRGGMDATTEFPNPVPAGVILSPFMQEGPVGLGHMSGFTIAKDGQARQSFALNAINLSKTSGAVVNTIPGMAVRQTIDATLVINNFNAVQSRLLSAAAVQTLARAGVPDALLSSSH
jgi:hypothetical protein